MNKFFIVTFLVCTILLNGQVKTPKDPTDPNKDSTDSVPKAKYNLEIKKQDGFFYKCFAEGMNGFYLDGLTWEGNESGNRKIMIDFVKSINIRGYKINVKTFDNLSLVYYVPQVFDIELKNGQSIKNAQGTIKQLDVFDVYDEMGKEKMYTFFVRYWQEDKKVFSDNNSDDFNETPAIPKNVVTFIEFTK